MALPLAAVSVLAGAVLAAPAPGGGSVVVAVAAGAAAHLVAVLVGAGLGALAARPVVGEPLLTPAVVLAGFVLVAVVPASSPLGPVLDLLRSSGDAAAPGLAGAVAEALLWTAAALGWAALPAAAGAVVAARRRTYGTSSPA